MPSSSQRPLSAARWLPKEIRGNEREQPTRRAYYEVKEANLKRLHAAGFQLYDIPEKAKLWRW